MGRGSLVLPLLAAYAFLVLAGPPRRVFAHDERPRPILRIDERLDSATEHRMSARRQSRLLLRRAHFSRQNGDPFAALSDLDRARELGAQGRFMSYERGLTLASLGRDEDALPELDRFLGTGRPTAIALNARAHLRERAGSLEQSLADYEASLALRDDAEIYLARGRVLQSLRRCDDAAEGYRAALARIGKAELLEKALVATLVTCGRHRAALAVVDEHLRSGRGTTDWLLLRGDVLGATGDRSGARAARERALASAEQMLSRKKTAILYYQRARAHVALGRFDEARADLERVLTATGTFQPALELANAVGLAAPGAVPGRASADPVDEVTLRDDTGTAASMRTPSNQPTGPIAQEENDHASFR